MSTSSMTLGDFQMKLKAILTAALFAVSANAAQAGWTGCHLGVQLGQGFANNKADLALGGVASLSIDGLAASGLQYGANFGCDLQVGDRFVVGAFADYMWADLKHTDTLTLGGLNATLSAAMKDSWTIGGRAGALVTPTTLAYGLIGYTNQDTADITLTTNAGFGLTLSPGTLSGLTLGGGIETKLMPNMSLSLEYRYTELDSVTMPIIAGATMELTPEVHSVRLGLNYRFDMADPFVTQMK